MGSFVKLSTQPMVVSDVTQCYVPVVDSEGLDRQASLVSSLSFANGALPKPRPTRVCGMEWAVSTGHRGRGMTAGTFPINGVGDTTPT